jgi:EAL domain-containing protein (putative c-di-GMP-specific phosphodiesterase class I)
MNTSTLALVQIENSDEVFTALGQASLEIFLDEFADRVQQFSRTRDEVVNVAPNKVCILLHGVYEQIQIDLAGAKLARLFEAPIQILNEEFRANVHTAFVLPGDEVLDTRSRLRIAEMGLSEARAQNQPYVVKTAAIERTTVGVKRVREIEVAFERGEFVMYFQPKVHAAYRTFVGAEALMRWHDPSQGVRSPADFIPYVEHSQVMRTMTWFAIKSSVAQAAEWADDLCVAVNVTPGLLLESALVDNVRDTLSIFDFDASRLTIEITEDAMVQDFAKTLDMLMQLRELGVKISIDDFGAGYSSIGYFRDLPIDELKIDRSFVANMLQRSRDFDLVKAITDLAHTLAMKVVAEGVEDEATADALQTLGVDVLQGYWFGKPMQGDDFVAAIKKP